MPDVVFSDVNIVRGLFLGRSRCQGTITYAAVTAFLPISENEHVLRTVDLKKLAGCDLHVIGTLSSTLEDPVLENSIKPLTSCILFRVLKSMGKNGTCWSSEEDKTSYQIVRFSPKDLLQSELLADNSPEHSFVGLVLESFDFSVAPELKKNLILFHETTRNECREWQVDEKDESLVWKALCLTTTGALLRFRVKQLKFLFANFSPRSGISLKVGNVLSAIMFDIMIGIIFTNILFRNPDPVSWLTVSVSFAENVISRLENLLYTLMEMPAGLKLNRPLNSTLGQFFLYHIYLLRTYVSIVKPVYMAIAEVVSLFGMCGLTCILSIVCDLFSLATVHIFCFYGYAARLYSFQTYSLSALWRLFRGKKWNHLKSRVDSYSYQYDQLFIGSISFTIVVFLLPTVVLYYCVFLTLRLATMALVVVIRLLIWKLSVIPVFAFFHAMHSSPKLVTGIYFEQRSGIFMKTTTVPWLHLFRTNPQHLVNPLAIIPEKIDVSSLLSRIVWGDILSPF